VHPDRPDFLDDTLHSATNPLPAELTTEYLLECMNAQPADKTQLAARALLYDMHEAGWLDKERYYGEFQHCPSDEEASGEACGEERADAYEEDNQNEENNQSEDEYDDMPPLVPYTTTA
jgi:hypothetical protein